MQALADTVGDGDEFRPMMACHYSGEPGTEKVCVGYVAKEGWSNLAVRLMAINGKIDINAIVDACEGLDLWPDFITMLTAYEEADDVQDQTCA